MGEFQIEMILGNYFHITLVSGVTSIANRAMPTELDNSPYSSLLIVSLETIIFSH